MHQPRAGRESRKIQRLVIEGDAIQPPRIEPASGWFEERHRWIETSGSGNRFECQSAAGGDFDPIGVAFTRLAQAPGNDDRELRQRAGDGALHQQRSSEHVERNFVGHSVRGYQA